MYEPIREFPFNHRNIRCLMPYYLRAFLPLSLGPRYDQYLLSNTVSALCHHILYLMHTLVIVLLK